MSTVDSSSDDDDCYVNSAKVLKTLKKKLIVTPSPIKQEPPPSPQEDVISLDEPGECSIGEFPAARTRSSSRRGAQTRQKTATNKNPSGGRSLQQLDENTPTDSISLVDSDTDDITSIMIPDDQDQDVTVDDVDENYEMTVKINWQSARLERVSLRKYQEFSKVFEYFSTTANVPQERIWLVFRNQITIQPTDTPDSLGLTIVDIIEGGIIDGNTEHNTVSATVDKDSINIKIQTKDQKKTLSLCIKKGQKIKVLIMKCAEQLQIGEDKIKLQFDGEPVHPNDTPESLDLEGGECFDMHIVP